MPLVRSLTLPTMKRRRARRAGPRALSTSAVGIGMEAEAEDADGSGFHWATEVEIEFVEPRLGVSLREVGASPTAPFPEFQAEVDALLKLHGRAGAAELYNWSVQPDKRLALGMRLTAIGGASLAGRSYKQVVRELKRAPRPVRLRFADVASGGARDSSSSVSSEQDARELEARELDAQRAQHAALFSQRQRELLSAHVTGELRTTQWRVDARKVAREAAALGARWRVLSRAFDGVQLAHRELVRAGAAVQRDRRELDKRLGSLEEQRAGRVENPEQARARRLEARHAQLSGDAARLDGANRKLREERAALRRALAEAEAQAAALKPADEEPEPEKDEEDEDKEDEALEDLGVDPALPPAEALAQLRRRAKALQRELEGEQRKLAKAQHEVQQLDKLGAELAAAAPRESTAVTRESSASAVPKTPEAALEREIERLREQRRAVVDSLSVAAQTGDDKLARACRRERQAIRQQLEAAQLKLRHLREGSAPVEEQQPESSKSGKSGKSSKPATMPTLFGFLDKGPTEWSDGGGGLLRRVKTKRGSRERWCEIAGDGVLRYYRRRGDAEPRGEIDLRDPSCELVCDDVHCEFVISTSAQQSRFFTRDEDELVAWVAALRGALEFLRARRRREEERRRQAELRRQQEQRRQQEAQEAARRERRSSRRRKSSKPNAKLAALAKAAQDKDRELSRHQGSFTLDDDYDMEPMDGPPRATLGFL